MRIHREEFKGFTIDVYALPEDISPAGQFDDDGETARAIADGDLTWFCAKVTASLDGVELADDYLGGCCYETESDFITAGGYYEDYRQGVVDTAKGVIRALAAKVA